MISFVLNNLIPCCACYSLIGVSARSTAKHKFVAYERNAFTILEFDCVIRSWADDNRNIREDGHFSAEYIVLQATSDWLYANIFLLLR